MCVRVYACKDRRNFLRYDTKDVQKSPHVPYTWLH